MPTFIEEWTYISREDCMYPPWMKDRGLGEWEVQYCPWWIEYPIGEYPRYEADNYKSDFLLPELACDNVIYSLMFST